MLLTRSQMIGMTRRRYKEIVIPDGVELPGGSFTSDCKVKIQSLTEAELATYEMCVFTFNKTGLVANEKGVGEQRRRLLRMVCVDEQNAQLYGPEDDELLQQLDGMLATLIHREACLHCGIRETEAPVDAKKN